MSIQQQIASQAYKLANSAVTPEQIKAVQAHVIKSVQDGSVPSYVGIPLLNDLNQRMGSIQNATAASHAMVNQPPIAQQVMGQAEQGVETLPSRLPEQAMAGGGIVAFANGGMSDSDMAAYLLADEDDEDDDYVRALMGDIQNREANEALEEEDEGVTGLAAMPAVRSSMSEARSGEKKAGLQSLLDLIEKKESGGRDYDKYGNLLTSSAGAQGRMQVMPATARDPGFGIRPAKEGDVEDLARVGKELYGKLLDKYQDPKLAAAAYNWGTGNVDKWLQSGGDESKLPAETRNYIKGFAEGGIARLAGGGLDDIFGMSPEDVKAAAARRLRMEQARSAFSAAPAAEAAPAAAATEGGVGSLLDAMKSGLGRINPRGSVGWSSLFYSPDLNANEEAELAKARLMTPTIGKAGTSVPLSSAAPAKAQPSGAGAGRGKQGGPDLEQSKQAAFEQAVGNTQDAEDMDAGINALQSQPAESAEGKKSGIDSMLDKYSEDIKKQREVNAYLGLLSAGLGMMGGTSPHAMANIGAGAQQGVSTYAGLNQATGADERALLGARIGAEKYKALNDIRQAQIAAQQQAKTAQNVLGQQRLDLSRQKAAADQLNEIRRMAQNKMIANYKGALLPEQKEQIMAQAEEQLMQDPAYAKLYEQVYGFKPSGSGGGKTIQFGDLGKK
jgi:hypothetical protein